MSLGGRPKKQAENSPAITRGILTMYAAQQGIRDAAEKFNMTADLWTENDPDKFTFTIHVKLTDAQETK